MCIIKKVFRTGLIATVALGTVAGAAALVAGPHRTRAVIHQVQDQVRDTIDASITDPVAMREQLRDMEKEYPKRIAQVRGDLAELNEQIRQLEREKAIAERVVELADADAGEIESQIGSFAALGAVNGEGESGLRLASLSTSMDDGTRRAVTRLQQIQATRVAYSNRAYDAEHDLQYLRQQAGRLDGLLTQLENERAQFQAQMVALSRQVDAIARNERLIDLLESRNETIEECSRYEAVSLDQITGRLAEIKSRQEAELDLLARAEEQGDYEELARLQLAGEALEAKAGGMREAKSLPQASVLVTPGNR